MKLNFIPVRRSARGFTLVELIVVIGIIAVLAAMLFPAGAAFKRKATLKKAQTELQQVASAVDGYKTRLGFYPPDNPNNFVVNPLYFELLGTTLISRGSRVAYETLNNAVTVNASVLSATVGVGGFMNCTRGGGDEVRPAQSFLSGLKPDQYAGLNSEDDSIRLLTCSIRWPINNPPWTLPGIPAGREINPWRYNSSSPTNNPGTYDLWVDLVIGKKIYRVGNWSEKPETVTAP